MKTIIMMDKEEFDRLYGLALIGVKYESKCKCQDVKHLKGCMQMVMNFMNKLDRDEE